jgi:hypothetical protein
MSTSGEWKEYKLHNLSRFKGKSFQLADYSAPSTDWDHDHCEGCAAKFAEFDGPEILHSGYFTIYEIGSPNREMPEFITQLHEQGRKVLAKPDVNRWVCKECFEEFRETLDWKLKSETLI